MMTKPLFLLMLIALVCAVSACGGNDETGGSPVVSGDISEIEVTIGGVNGSPPWFQPKQIEVKRGTTAKFRVSGSDDQKHTFTVSTLDIDLPVPAGETVETEAIVFNKATNVFFICRLHTALGATGTIRVTN